MSNDTIPLDPTPTPPEQPRRRFPARPVLIGAVSAAAVLGLGVGGFALADTLDDATDDRIVISSSPTNSSAPTPGASSTPSPSSSSDDDVQPSDAQYADVTAAALAAVGGGTVTEVDRGDSPGDAAWKVEIRLANGDEAEVRLDANLTVIRVELDNDHSGSSTSGSDDSGSDDSGSDDSDDSGSDDSGSGSDDSGSGGHGSDD